MSSTARPSPARRSAVAWSRWASGKWDGVRPPAPCGAVGGDLPQRGRELPGERGDGGPLMQVRGVGPGQLEPLVLDPAGHVQLVSSRRVRAHPGVQAMVDRVDQAAVGERLVQPAEVIEADRRPGTASRVGAIGQVAQRAVAEPAVRDGPQLFLDRLQCRIPPAGRHADRDREDGGEPAHRAGQVAALEQVLLRPWPSRSISTRSPPVQRARTRPSAASSTSLIWVR